MRGLRDRHLLYRRLAEEHERRHQSVPPSLPPASESDRSAVALQRSSEGFARAVERLNAVLNAPFTADTFERELRHWHELLTQGHPGLRGFGGAYQPPEKAEAVHRLVQELFSEQADARIRRDPLGVAAQLYGDLVNLQPFRDGNQRLAGLALNYLLLKLHYTPFLVTEDNMTLFLSENYDNGGLMRDWKVDVSRFRALLERSVKPSGRDVEAGAAQLSELDLPGHYVDTLYVLDTRINTMVPLRFVRADQLSQPDGDRLRKA